MNLLIVRHAQSVGNRDKRMQGRLDYPLSDEGRKQAELLGSWLAGRGIVWDFAYTSPLARARQTADSIADAVGGPRAEDEPLMAEIAAGSLEGLTKEDMASKQPSFLERPIEDLGEFGEFGGETYDEVQDRARRLLLRLEERHRKGQHVVLLVGHGGINFQLIKSLVCTPVPRVCILRLGNCSATLVKMRDRRGRYLGEITWHVPLELMGGQTEEGASALFR